MSQSIFILDLKPDEVNRVAVDMEPPDGEGKRRARLTVEGQTGHRIRVYFDSLPEVEEFVLKIADGIRFLRGEMPV